MKKKHLLKRMLLLKVRKVNFNLLKLPKFPRRDDHAIFSSKRKHFLNSVLEVIFQWRGFRHWKQNSFWNWLQFEKVHNVGHSKGLCCIHFKIQYWSQLPRICRIPSSLRLRPREHLCKPLLYHWTQETAQNVKLSH